MQKLKFKEKPFHNIKNENFKGVLSKYFTKTIFDKRRNRLLLLGGCEILKFNKDIPLFSVFSPDLYPSLEKLQNHVYQHGKTKINKKYWKNDVIVSEILNEESEGMEIFRKQRAIYFI